VEDKETSGIEGWKEISSFSPTEHKQKQQLWRKTAVRCLLEEYDILAGGV